VDIFTRRPDKQTDNLRVSAGFEFAPDAIIKGRATVGFHEMVARGSGSFPFAGWIASVDLGYSLLGRTRFDVRFARDATYSVLDGEGYYLSTAGGLEILHNLVGPLDVWRGSCERLDYASPVAPGH
jgi:hypothetical protein